jgi:hypothetical protein
MYDRTQAVGGMDIEDVLGKMQENPQSDTQSMEQPAEVARDEAPRQELAQGLLGNVPKAPQQEQQEVELQESPGVVVQDNAEALAHGGNASGGAAEMASSAKAADADAKMAAQQLEAKKSSLAAQTDQQAMAEYQRMQQEQDPLSQIFGLGMQLLPLFI